MAKIEEFKSRTSALAEDDLQDEFYRPAAAPKLRAEPAPRYQPEVAQEEDAFLRTRRRVPVRKGLLPQTRVGRIALAAGVLVSTAALVAAAMGAREVLKRDPRFRIDSSDSIQILGNSRVTRPELLSVFGSDIGRNVFFVPLAERRSALESLPWVEHATVMRLLPNQLQVAIVERTPVAFVRTGNEIELVDGSGVILSMPPATMAAMHYSFPVVTGIDAADPLSTRSARMRIYRRFIDGIDGMGEKISAQMSEIDLSDPEDVKALVPVPDAGSEADSSGARASEILLHFGDEDFLARFHNYQAHLADWRQQYPHLASVDLRYERQVVLEMDKATSDAATVAAAASVERKTAAAGSAVEITGAAAGQAATRAVDRKGPRKKAAPARKSRVVSGRDAGRRGAAHLKAGAATARAPGRISSSTLYPKTYVDARPVASAKDEGAKGAAK